MDWFGARPLFVHAHPDDESIGTGGTIALLADSGAVVTVLTCTRGELGEIVDPTLDVRRGLAAVREDEIARALARLTAAGHRRVRHRFLDGYVDSGMRWGADGRAEPLDPVAPEAFTSAPFERVVADVAATLEDIAPTSIVSYDDGGGYGHPDHVRAGRAARAAAAAASLPFFAVDAGGDLAVDVSRVLDRKRAALREYRSQLVVGEDWFAGANGERESIGTVERYRLRPPVGVVDDG